MFRRPTLVEMAYIASQDKKKAGDTILISHLCPIQITNSILDPNGRFIILQTLYQGTPLVLCNVYNRNVARIGFLNCIFSKLARLPLLALIIGGDFNVAFSNVKDKLLLPCLKSSVK